MGIPSYFKSIVNKYPDIIYNIRYINQLYVNKKIDKLFIDFNSIIHKCAGKITHDDIFIKNNDMQIQVINESISYVNEIINMIQPTDITYISVDGVCPRAKMCQQRKRRYLSSLRYNLVKDDTLFQNENNSNWNSNIVTPGTSFMKNMDFELKRYFNDTNKYIVSGSDEPGEGEHKIYEFIHRYNQKNDNINIIYGLDADLIMLSLLENNNILLLREKNDFKSMDVFNTHKINTFQDDFLLLDINTLKKSLIHNYSNFIEFDQNHFINDYVFLCAFLGNDFLPPLSYVKIKDNSLDKLITIYFQILSQLKQYLINDQGYINFTFLQSLFKILSEDEDKMMQNAFDLYQIKNINKKPDTKSYKNLLYQFDNYGTLNKTNMNFINPHLPGWRINYYHHLFDKSLHISSFCHIYLQGLQWIADYYFKKQQYVFNWYYPYSYSPTILDISNYLHTLHNLPRPTVDIDNHTYCQIMQNDYMQPLLVLPPTSYYLIPYQNISCIMKDISYNCLHYYPHKFKIQSFLKHYIWECSPCLPEIDILHLYECAKKC